MKRTNGSHLHLRRPHNNTLKILCIMAVFALLSMAMAEGTRNSLETINKSFHESESNQEKIKALHHPDMKEFVDLQSKRFKEDDEDIFHEFTRYTKSHPIDYGDYHPYDVLRRRRIAQSTNSSLSAEDQRVLKRHLQNKPWSADGRDSSTFNPIRIHLDTKFLALVQNDYGPEVNFLNTVLLPKVKDAWEDVIRVYQTLSNVVVTNDRCPISSLSQNSTGIPDTDLVVFVAANLETVCQAATKPVVAANSCQYDMYDRPIVGRVTICLKEFDLSSEYSIQTYYKLVLHGFAHILGFSHKDYQYYYNPKTGKPRTERPFKKQVVTCVDGKEHYRVVPSESTIRTDFTNRGLRYFEVTTPAVRQMARNQFNCQTMSGARLENQPTNNGNCFGSHWEARLFAGDLVTAISLPTKQVLSDITLALFEDSGWYQVNYGPTSTSSFGKGRGCNFVYEDCIEDGKVPEWSKGIFCNELLDDGLAKLKCDYHNSYMSLCDLMDYNEITYAVPPNRNQRYFPDHPSYGGLMHTADYCPMRSIIQQDCTAPLTIQGEMELEVESYSPDSRCINTDGERPLCMKAECNKQLAKSVIYARDDIGDFQPYICENDGDIMEIPGVQGTVECPIYELMCPDEVCPNNCSGRGVCNHHSFDIPICQCCNVNDYTEDCSNSEICNPDKDENIFYCGKSEMDAAQCNENTPCFSGMNNECPQDEQCYIIPECNNIVYYPPGSYCISTVTGTVNCDNPCSKSDDCSPGQICSRYEDCEMSLAPTPTASVSENSFCGATISDASAAACIPINPCITNFDCPWGQDCFQDVTCGPVEPEGNGFCGVSKDLATRNCGTGTVCSTDFDCSWGQDCFQDVTCDPSEPEGNGFCGVSKDLATRNCGIGTACSKSSDCLPGETCHTDVNCIGFCGDYQSDAVNNCSLDTVCVQSSDCAPGQSCYIDVNCAGFCGLSELDAVQQCGRATACVRTRDCAPGLLCYPEVNCVTEGFCGNSVSHATATCSLDTACVQDSDCGLDGESCHTNVNCVKEGYCGNSELDAAATCSDDTICVQNSDCAPGQSCYTDFTCVKSGFCGNSKPHAAAFCGLDTECFRSSDCPSSQSCYTDIDCVNGGFCGNSELDAAATCSLDKTCAQNSDCPIDQSCYSDVTCDGFCGNSEPHAASICGVDTACTLTSDCPPGQSCYPGVACDGFCGNSEPQAASICSVDTACGRNTDCPPDQSCHPGVTCDGFCGMSKPHATSICGIDTACVTNTDCPLGQSCFNGMLCDLDNNENMFCALTAEDAAACNPGASCLKKSDCPPDHSCFTVDACTPNPFLEPTTNHCGFSPFMASSCVEGTECVTDSDCPYGQECHDVYCRTEGEKYCGSSQYSASKCLAMNECETDEDCSDDFQTCRLVTECYTPPTYSPTQMPVPKPREFLSVKYLLCLEHGILTTTNKLTVKTQEEVTKILNKKFSDAVQDVTGRWQVDETHLRVENVISEYLEFGNGNFECTCGAGDGKAVCSAIDSVVTISYWAELDPNLINWVLLQFKNFVVEDIRYPAQYWGFTPFIAEAEVKVNGLSENEVNDDFWQDNFKSKIHRAVNSELERGDVDGLVLLLLDIDKITPVVTERSHHSSKLLRYMQAENLYSISLIAGGQYRAPPHRDDFNELLADALEKSLRSKVETDVVFGDTLGEDVAIIVGDDVVDGGGNGGNGIGSGGGGASGGNGGISGTGGGGGTDGGGDGGGVGETGKESGSNVGIVIGILFGILAFVIILIMIIICHRRKKEKENEVFNMNQIDADTTFDPSIGFNDFYGDAPLTSSRGMAIDTYNKEETMHDEYTNDNDEYTNTNSKLTSVVTNPTFTGGKFEKPDFTTQGESQRTSNSRHSYDERASNNRYSYDERASKNRFSYDERKPLNNDAEEDDYDYEDDEIGTFTGQAIGSEMKDDVSCLMSVRGVEDTWNAPSNNSTQSQSLNDEKESDTQESWTRKSSSTYDPYTDPTTAYSGSQPGSTGYSYSQDEMNSEISDPKTYLSAPTMINRRDSTPTQNLNRVTSYSSFASSDNGESGIETFMSAPTILFERADQKPLQMSDQIISKKFPHSSSNDGISQFEKDDIIDVLSPKPLSTPLENIMEDEIKEEDVHQTRLNIIDGARSGEMSPVASFDNINPEIYDHERVNNDFGTQPAQESLHDNHDNFIDMNGLSHENEPKIIRTEDHTHDVWNDSPPSTRRNSESYDANDAFESHTMQHSQGNDHKASIEHSSPAIIDNDTFLSENDIYSADPNDQKDAARIEDHVHDPLNELGNSTQMANSATYDTHDIIDIPTQQLSQANDDNIPTEMESTNNLNTDVALYDNNSREVGSSRDEKDITDNLNTDVDLYDNNSREAGSSRDGSDVFTVRRSS